MSEPSQPTPPVPPAPPVPRYGEYAPEGYVPPRPAPGFEAAGGWGAPQPGVRRRRTWDTVLTIVLLGLGLFGAGLGVVYGVAFTSPDLIDQALKAQGYPGFSGSVGAAPAVIIASHVVLYLAAVGGSIALLLNKRIAFWLPLACGVLASLIFFGSVVAILVSDPALMSGQLS